MTDSSVVIIDDKIVREQKQRLDLPVPQRSEVEPLDLDSALANSNMVSNFISRKQDDANCFEEEDIADISEIVTREGQLADKKRHLKNTTPRGEQSESNKTLYSVLDEAVREEWRSGELGRARLSADSIKDRKHFCLTGEYKDAGGIIDADVYLLAEPKLSLHPNHIHRSDDARAIRDEVMDYESAIDAVRSVDPDVVLCDLQFRGSVPEGLQDQYLQKKSEKQQEPFKVELPEGFGHALRFPSREASYERRSRRGFHFDPSKTAGRPNQHCGAFTGALLDQQDIDYSFWTSGFGHARDAFVTAHTLDQFTKEDFVSLKESYCRVNKKTRENIALRLPASDRGNLIVSEKRMFNYDVQDGEWGHMRRKMIPYLDSAISMAYRCKRMEPSSR